VQAAYRGRGGGAPPSRPHLERVEAEILGSPRYCPVDLLLALGPLDVLSEVLQAPDHQAFGPMDAVERVLHALI
jgi:hypothetical protein